MTLVMQIERKTERLPSTACEPSFREEAQVFAKSNGITEGELIRQALRFFLDLNVGKTDMKVSKRKTKAGKKTPDKKTS